jgi:hypothetical protein
MTQKREISIDSDFFVYKVKTEYKKIKELNNRLF